MQLPPLFLSQNHWPNPKGKAQGQLTYKFYKNNSKSKSAVGLDFGGWLTEALASRSQLECKGLSVVSNIHGGSVFLSPV